jgi:hypothetical protein
MLFRFWLSRAEVQHGVLHVLLLLLQVFLNMQDRQLALRGKSSWVQDYYMPAPCDGLVIAGGVEIDF